MRSRFLHARAAGLVDSSDSVYLSDVPVLERNLLRHGHEGAPQLEAAVAWYHCLHGN